jgi:TetR/AcrR family transcriptional regulator of autoinduction and epiphytic fitness
MGERRGGVDGRVLRRRRNRTAALDAFLSLIDEGDLRPTAQAIASRAGLSVRSVFHHFDDLEQIYALAGERVLQRLAPDLEPIDGDLSRDERLELFALRRTRLLEALHPIAQAARPREPFSDQLRDNRDMLNARLRAQTEGAFACELAGLPAHHRQLIADTLALSTEWGTWYLLREELHLAPAQAGQRFRVLLNQLIEPADFAHIGTISSEEPV